MRKFDKCRLMLGIITALVAVIAFVYVSVILKDDNLLVAVFIALSVGMFYSSHRWMDGYLKKNPKASWRKLPRFQIDEPILNVYCLNFYKWIIMFIVLIFVLSEYM